MKMFKLFCILGIHLGRLAVLVRGWGAGEATYSEPQSIRGHPNEKVKPVNYACRKDA
jgi:hypothetical protein